jgi:diguanylate cyclase (GGDEF)-like protein
MPASMGSQGLPPGRPTVRSTQAPSWADLPLAGRSYIAVVVALGVFSMIGAAAGLREPVVAPLTALGVLSFLTAFAKVTVAVPGSVSTLSFCYVIDFTTLLVLGPAAATCTAACGAWSQMTFGSTRPGPAYRTWFSIAALALTVRTAASALAWTGGDAPSATWALGLLLSAAVYFLTNSALIAGAVALTTRRRTIAVWRKNFLPLWLGQVVGFGLAVGAAAALRQSMLWLLPFMAIMFALIYQKLHAYVAGLSASLADPMTGLPNLRHLREHVAHELDRAARASSALAILMIDLDDFKTINDSYGHHTGDAALRHVADQLHHSIRSYDMCARYAGDEFVVVLPGCSAEQAQAKAAALQQVVAARRVECAGREPFVVRISVGAAVFPQDGRTFDELLAVADAAMFERKRRARVRHTAPEQVRPERLAAAIAG